MAEKKVATLEQLNQLRLTRTHIVKLQTRYFSHMLTSKLIGCYVRVLLEDTGHQTYRVATISGTRQGASYDTMYGQRDMSSLYLDLYVANAESDTTTIQLNSISNSNISEQEYQEFLSTCPAANVPTFEALEAKYNELVPCLVEAGVDREQLASARTLREPTRRLRIVKNATGQPQSQSQTNADNPASPLAESDEVSELRKEVERLQVRVDQLFVSCAVCCSFFFSFFFFFFLSLCLTSCCTNRRSLRRYTIFPKTLRVSRWRSSANSRGLSTTTRRKLTPRRRTSGSARYVEPPPPSPGPVLLLTFLAPTQHPNPGVL